MSNLNRQYEKEKDEFLFLSLFIIEDKMKNAAEEVCKVFEETKNRFIQKNKEHSSVFFKLGKDSAYRNIWKKWITVQEFFDGKVEFDEERRKDFLDFAIYLLMTVVYVTQTVHKSEKRKFSAFGYDSKKEGFIKIKDFDEKEGKTVFESQHFKIVKYRDNLIFLDYGGRGSNETL